MEIPKSGGIYLKILGIVGSKRKNGNTAALVKKTMTPFEESELFETEIIYIGDLNIEGCRGCEGCAVTNRCVIKDDMQEVYKKLRQADSIIAGSPTYFYNMTSEMKKFIDRCYCFCSFDKSDRSVWISEFEQGPQKYAGIIAVSEQNNIEDMGFTPEAMRLSFQSLGYRIISNQKALHAFKAGEILSFEDTMELANNNGEKLLKTILLSRGSIKD